MHKKTDPTVIVVVEDDPDTRYIFQVALEAQYTVHVVSTITPDGLLALHADLVFMDLWLNDQSGSDLCRELKCHPATKSIPIVLCSAVNGLPAIREECQADAYIAKPFDLDDLFRAVETFIKSKSLA